MQPSHWLNHCVLLGLGTITTPLVACACQTPPCLPRYLNTSLRPRNHVVRGRCRKTPRLTEQQPRKHADMSRNRPCQQTRTSTQIHWGVYTTATEYEQRSLLLAHPYSSQLEAGTRLSYSIETAIPCSLRTTDDTPLPATLPQLVAERESPHDHGY
ncbi:hypothetical protein LX32DRAFT_318697 [Colletotrichum zoysiae]|uniref:Secreted protein n=1 Tax=Colletotrichum zoysiae TaxID=1216348 RepID=A0AAD9H233_9PEZI|nr:hypothetical protein LX32DRAFT_318697 [Colletotrichum zoysiae]